MAGSLSYFFFGRDPNIETKNTQNKQMNFDSSAALDLRHTALLVVDGQQRFDECLAGTPLTNVVRLLDAAAAAHACIALTQHHDPDPDSALMRFLGAFVDCGWVCGGRECRLWRVWMWMRRR